MARGLDVSSYQTASQWTGMLPEFVFIKASEGGHTHDPRFGEHLDAALRQRVPIIGAYHFGWPIQDANADAHNFASALGANVGAGRIRALALDLEPYADSRNVGDLSAHEIQGWAARWIASVRLLFRGVKVGVYADLSHYGAGWVPRGADYYWVAEYRGGMTYSRAEASRWPAIGPAYPDLLFWQFNSAPLDMDISLKDASGLRAFFGAPAPAGPPKPIPAPRPAKTMYTVKAGDTLSGIAAAHGVSLIELEHLNPQVKNPNLIYAGQVLTLPPGAAQLPVQARYKVRKGDTMSQIAAAHGVTLTALERANPTVRNPNLIYAGQTLIIPARP
jgi:LysM repeat protein/GH25 family lysozyme M1 (1,4-beta-N-acetylmuramidase)